MSDQPTYLQKLRDKISTASSAAQANLRRFMGLARQLGHRSVSGAQIMKSEPDQLTLQMRVHHLGKMSMFFYDPKTKDKLPYYDRFPLIIPIELYDDGFLGLNLHYLAPGLRARLMDELYQHVYPDNRDEIDKQRRIKISYQIVKRASRNRFYKPCVKRYLYSHLRSKIFVLPVSEWDVALFLPTQRFTKASDSTVWRESARISRGN